MAWKEQFVRLATKPWVLASGVAAAVLHVTGTAALWQFLVAMSAKWFGTLAIVSGFIAPNIPWLPTDIVLGMVAAIAVIVFIRKAGETIQWMRDTYL